MLVLRLQRTGRSNLATYRIVAAEKARPVKGKFLEILGHYLPQQRPAVLKYEEERITAWIKKGAKPSNTLARLLRTAGVKGMDPFIVRYAKRRPKGEEPAAAAPAVPAPVVESAEKSDTAEKKE